MSKPLVIYQIKTKSKTKFAKAHPQLVRRCSSLRIPRDGDSGLLGREISEIWSGRIEALAGLFGGLTLNLKRRSASGWLRQ